MKDVMEMLASLDASAAAAELCAPSYVPQIHRAILSHSVPIPLPRTFDDVHRCFGGASYEEGEKLSARVNASGNLHIGQRKLALALIQFATKCHRKEPGPILFVYAGASVLASLAASALFPNDTFLCFDPSYEMTIPVAKRALGARAESVFSQRVSLHYDVPPANKIVNSLKRKSIVVMTRRAGWFDRNMCAFCSQVAANLGSELALVSDIRRSAKPGQDREAMIARDMAQQALWTALLRVRFFCVKFRLPFTSEARVLAEYAPLTTSNAVPQASAIPYLSGSRMLQMYARNGSTEMRLMGTRRPNLTYYDAHQVEAGLAAFNVVHRNQSSFEPWACPVPCRITRHAVMAHACKVGGGSACFDTMAEACVLRDATAVVRPDASDALYVCVCTAFCQLFGDRLRMQETTSAHTRARA